MKKLLCLLAVTAMMTLGLSGLALADAPAADAPMAVKKVSNRGINYPAYLYAKGQRGEKTYKALVHPAKGYDFKLVPLASRHYVPAEY